MTPLLLLLLAQLPEGPGKAETVQLCSECHEIERVTSRRQTLAAWQETVNKMTSLGMTSTDSEIRSVLGYLTKNFGAGVAPKLRLIPLRKPNSKTP